jgi:tetratricopeptide (TPR) repeat protein
VDKVDFEKGYEKYVGAIISKLKESQREVPLSLDEAEEAHRADPDSAPATARYAVELLKANRRKEARQLAEEALEKNSKEPLAAVVMAQLELRSEDYESAAKWVEAALDRKHPHPRVLETLAEIRLRQEKPAEAAEAWSLGLKHDPGRVDWLKGLATALLQTGDKQRLKETLEKIAAIDGEDAPVRQKLTRIALDEKKYDEAIRYGRMALEIDVMDLETHRMLGQAYAAAGQSEKSISEWKIAVELKPDDLDLVVSLAQAEVEGGQKQAAAARLDELLSRHSDFAPARKLRKSLE